MEGLYDFVMIVNRVCAGILYLAIAFAVVPIGLDDWKYFFKK